ncbi:hypothetical protein [Mycolicibacterium gilvum]|uniref:DNA-binding protein n=1 Tax=Mycolicibacterium gilvum (strain DSM 45189 / LMG 24558 / Spyr1) TaxID=278137 RepID=E6TE12_MYCSR|nr:hypothetical protein [Mycolicibacterium gilvum]ADT99856.1 hypothetical protein Mspyr1_32450 [Mycolicibacterium gilvum Spyr1]
MDDLDGYVELAEVAARMNITEAQVMDLVRHRVLRAVNLGLGLIMVEPAILSGSVSTPRPA